MGVISNNAGRVQKGYCVKRFINLQSFKVCPSIFTTTHFTTILIHTLFHIHPDPSDNGPRFWSPLHLQTLSRSSLFSMTRLLLPNAMRGPSYFLFLTEGFNMVPSVSFHAFITPPKHNDDIESPFPNVLPRTISRRKQRWCMPSTTTQWSFHCHLTSSLLDRSKAPSNVCITSLR